MTDLNPTGPVLIEWGRTDEHDAWLEALVDDGLLVPVGTELYEHDGEARTSNGEYVSASEALQNAIEWGMCRVGEGDNDE